MKIADNWGLFGDGGLSDAERRMSDAIGVAKSLRYELQLAVLPVDGGSDFPRRFGAKVRALGGRFSEARGSTHTRFVTLDHTPEAAELASKMLQTFAQFGSTTIVFRSGADALVLRVPGRADGTRPCKGTSWEEALATAEGWVAGKALAALIEADEALRRARARQRPLLEQRVGRLRELLVEAEKQLAAFNG